MNHAMRVRRFSLLAVMALLAGCLTSVVVTAITTRATQYGYSLWEFQVYAS